MTKHTFVATIASVERVGANTNNGNPRHQVFFAGDIGSMLTDADGAVNYGITNSENIGVPVEITTRGDKIIRVTPVGSGR
ncbi:MAG TPA: hypothetical protein VK735_39515 [Pseudonocardia sp.]|uniref:hypothetical protein n=1 Tax=Pseudonocardia sp. TaxID=60912 RepID=UPI002B9D8440|nr:hypothetical protein [Pseudonocardia sp.]HTF53571.1 hypothetical protein [Pseudonocardia sp.]